MVRSETTGDWWNPLGEKYYSVMGNVGSKPYHVPLRTRPEQDYEA
jgi:hypothetical protein